MQIKTAMRYHLTHITLDTIKKLNMTSVSKEVKKLEFLWTGGEGCKMGQPI